MIKLNDWGELDEVALEVAEGDFVSVIVPAHCTQEMLDLCLTALVAQSMAHDSFEVVVVDHKSEPALRLPSHLPESFNVSLHRLDTGHGPGAARAFGADLATGHVFVFIDVDILSAHDMVQQYARVPSHDPSVVALGFREFVNPAEVDTSEIRHAIANHTLMEYVASRPATEGQEWIDAFLARANGGLTWRDDLWVVVVGAGIGVSRYLYTLAGGFRDYPVHGVEDTEIGWRLFQAGAVIAPLRGAVGVHWGLRSISVNRAEIMHRREGFLSNHIAHNRHRVPGLGRTWAVPKVLVQVVCSPESTVQEVLQTSHDLLRATESDLAIEIIGEHELEDSELAHSWLDPEPRVTFATASVPGVPESTPYVLRTLAGARFTRDAVANLLRELNRGNSGLLCVVAASDSVTAELWRTSALARASFFAPEGVNPREALRVVADEQWKPGDPMGVGYIAGASDAVKSGGRWMLEENAK